MERVRGAENDHSLLRAYVGQGEFETNHGGDVGVDVVVAGVALQPIANGPGRQRGVPPIGFDQGGRLVFAKKRQFILFFKFRLGNGSRSVVRNSRNLRPRILDERTEIDTPSTRAQLGHYEY